MAGKDNVLQPLMTTAAAISSDAQDRLQLTQSQRYEMIMRNGEPIAYNNCVDEL